MERKLASIQIVNDVQPIEGADAIEKVTILGWECVSKKGEFKPGDLCVYFEIDSFLPVRDEFEFLRKSSFKHMGDEQGFRLRTVRLRKQLSQGLVLPVSAFPGISNTVDDDVTEFLNVKKWDPPVPAQLRGQVKGNFPGFLIKTDEIRIQSAPRLLHEIMGQPYYISTKLDGTSGTFYYRDKFGVCSRNMELEKTDGNVYWDVATKCNLEEVLQSVGYNICIQGEICGPGIQKNPLKLNSVSFFVFNVFDIDKHRYFTLDEMKDFCSKHGLNTVPIEEEGDSFNYSSVSEILERAKGKYDTGNVKEGIVIREINNVFSSRLTGRLSFKAINNDFLLKEE